MLAPRSRIAMPLAVRALLRVFVNFMLAAGIAALGASLSIWLSAPASAREWLQPVFLFSVRVGITFLFASICALMLIPGRTALSQPTAHGQSDAPWTAADALIVALGVAVVVQVPALLAWWSRSAALPSMLLPGQPDPFGMRFVVAVFAHITPLLLAFASLALLLTSVVGYPRATGGRFRLVAAGTIVGCAYLFGAYSTLGALEDAASYIPSLPGAESEPWLVTILNWAREHVAGGSTLVTRFAWVAAGYTGAVAIITFGKRYSEAVNGVGTSASNVPTTTDDTQGAAGEAFVVASHFGAEDGGVISESTYAIRARGLGPMALFTRVPEYEIDSVPSSSQHKFSFSWKTGRLRREPAGPDLVSVTTRKGQGIRSILSRPSYEVIEASTGRPLALVVPSGPAWSIADVAGRQVAEVDGPHRVGDATRYITRAAGAEACRFDWAMLGATILSAELTLEFARNAPVPFDRIVAIVVGVLLEQQARQERQRYSS